jgi:hypothetical protein
MSNHDPYSDCHVRGLGRVFFSLFSFSLVLTDPCGRGGAREHLGERTRTGGTEPARHPPPEVVLASAGRDGAVRPPWILRNRPLAALAGALTRSAAAYEVDARSLQPTVVTRPGGSISRGGSAPQGFRTQIPFCLYTPQSIYVSRYIQAGLRQRWPKWVSIASSGRPNGRLPDKSTLAQFSVLIRRTKSLPVNDRRNIGQ